MAFNVKEWLNENSKDEVLFLYEGEVSSSLITDSLDLIEEKLADASSKAKKKIYNVLVECMQNLYHHSAELNVNGSTTKNKKFGICILSKNSMGYLIKTGNFVKEKQKDFLTKHLNHINSLDRDALKELYKEILNNQEFSEKGGGGLGMVDIARKSGSKLDYLFFDHFNDFYFFSLNINILE